MIAQIPYDEAADAIRSLADADRLVGYAGVQVQVDQVQMTLYWQGSIPNAIADFVRAAKVKIAILPAVYSLAELDGEEHRVLGFSSADMGATLVGTAPLGDYSGIQVVVDRSSLGSLTTADVQARVSALGSSIRKTVSLGDPSISLSCPTICPTGRWADTEPFYGAAAIYNDGGGNCGDGWSVTNNSTGVVGILTAYHCLYSTNPPYYLHEYTPPSGNKYVGSGNLGGGPPNDSTVVSKGNILAADEYAPRIYTGPWDSRSSTPVVNDGLANPGDAVQPGRGHFWRELQQ
jgi:hypothetical protein